MWNIVKVVQVQNNDKIMIEKWQFVVCFVLFRFFFGSVWVLQIIAITLEQFINWYECHTKMSFFFFAFLFSLMSAPHLLCRNFWRIFRHHHISATLSSPRSNIPVKSLYILFLLVQKEFCSNFTLSWLYTADNIRLVFPIWRVFP